MDAVISQAELIALLHYDPETGHFTWKNAGNVQNKRLGMSAGWSNSAGYRVITIENRRVFAHRLAWLYVYGEYPHLMVDHIDGNKSNNAISNLRLATRSQNAVNTHKNRSNKLGIKGVNIAYGRYRAQIGVNGKKYCLGHFATPEEAKAAYEEAAKLHFGEFANVGK